MGDWVIEAHRQNIGTVHFNWNNTRQDKKKASKLVNNEG